LKIGGRHLVVPAYLLLSLAFTWPLAAEFDRSMPSVFGPLDALLQSFLVGWDYQALGHDPVSIWNPPIFHPEPRALTYMDHMIGETIVAAPVIAATGNIAAGYNVLVILSFVMSGWAVYRLVRFLGPSRPAAFLAGFLFAFSPYRFSNLGLLNQVQTQFIPLGLFFALRYFRHRRDRDLVATAAVFLVQAWFGWYYTFHLALALALLAAWELAGGRTAWRDVSWKRATLVTTVTLLLILPGVIPYWQQQRSMPTFRRSLGSTALHSADLLDYVKVNVENRLGALVPAFRSHQGYWPGLVSVAFAALGLAGLARGGSSRMGVTPRAPIPADGEASIVRGGSGRVQRLRRIGDGFRDWADRTGVWGYFVILGATAFVLSLGPVLQVAGRRLLVPLPYSLAYYVIPGFASMRAPGRFAGLVVLAAAVLAGLGYGLLERRLRGSRRAALFGGVLAVAGLTAWSAPVPLTVFPRRDTMPEAYHWIARQPGEFAILELPAPPTEPEEKPIDAARQVYALYHGKARIDGVSGFVPPRFHAFRKAIQDFPEPGPLDEARRLGARYILFHYGDLDPPAAARLRQEAARATGLSVAADFGSDVVYELIDPE
jgi:hypothetical protein